MRKKKQDITDIFVRHRKLTLGIKLVGTFAFTYYLVYFVLLTVFGIYYRSVYDVVICAALGHSRNDGREFGSVIQKTTLWKVSVYDFYYNSCYISVCYS